MGSHSRVHYMDNLRAFAMLLGIFFHAVLAYSPLLHYLWPVADSENSAVVDMLAFFSHTFRMPLFFIIAGFFTALLIQKRGLAAMVKNRLMRITLPFSIFLPLVMTSFVVIFGWAINDVENKSPMLAMISMTAQMPQPPEQPITTSHLWFLYNLTFFYVVTTVLVKFVRIDWMAKVQAFPKIFLIAAPLLLVPAYMTQHLPLPAPEQFTPQLWSFGSYGLFFMLGYGLFKYENFLDKLTPYWGWMLIAGVTAYGVFYQQLPATINMQDMMVNIATAPDFDLNQAFLAALQAYTGVYISLVLLVLGRKFFNQQNAAVKIIADSSYWIYIIHLPVLWTIQFALLDTQLPLIVEFLISSIGTLIIGFISYLLLVKYTPIGWLLNGKISKPTAQTAEA
ncbi:acyltransferase family protein [Alteromonadaceae bacterium BrNp21-10]|nr:acyltransferase family protein [Alteromonadaceae bacterium BrNp21-10]